MLLSVVAALERLRVLTEVRWALLRNDALVAGGVRVANKLALSVQVFPLLVQLFTWSDDHVGSRILHWLVRAHGMGAVVHALVVGMNRHLHHVLLVGIRRAVLSQKWRIALDCNGLRSVMCMHPVVWMA